MRLDQASVIRLRTPDHADVSFPNDRNQPYAAQNTPRSLSARYTLHIRGTPSIPFTLFSHPNLAPTRACCRPIAQHLVQSTRPLVDTSRRELLNPCSSWRTTPPHGGLDSQKLCVLGDQASDNRIYRQHRHSAVGPWMIYFSLILLSTSQQ